MSNIVDILKKYIPYPIYEFVWRIWHGHFSYYFWLFPLKKNKICISSYYGKGYGDNSKYIVESLLERNINEIEIVWLVNSNFGVDKKKFPKEVRIVEYGTWRSLYELATSHIWIDDCRKFIYPPKRKNQFYIQTWHGGIPLKKIEKDAGPKLGRFYVNMAKRDSSMTDLMLSNSKFNTEIFKKSFWYQGPVWEQGVPRNEYLERAEGNKHREKLWDFIGIETEKVCLYAPTFRDSHDTDVYDLDYQSLHRALKQKTGDDWTILLRLHPNMSHLAKNFSINQNVFDVTEYPDMQDLILASDLLITDYSSSMFDQMFSDNICFIYANDVESYSQERGMYFTFDELPFPVAKNNTELNKLISDFDQKQYKKEVDDFKNRLGVFNQDVLNYLTFFLQEKCLGDKRNRIL